MTSPNKVLELIEQQTNVGNTNFYFVLKRGTWETLQRYPITDAQSITNVLSNLKYLHTKIAIPYFEQPVKKEK